MTDAEYEALKARVMASMDKWRPLLGLDDWELDVNFVRDSRHPAEPDCVAEVTHKWEYESASVALYCPAAETRRPDDLDGDMLHELVHLLLAPMSRQGATPEQQGLEELTVVRATRAFRRVDVKAALARDVGVPTEPFAAAMMTEREKWPEHDATPGHESGRIYVVGCERCDLEAAANRLLLFHLGAVNA